MSMPKSVSRRSLMTVCRMSRSRLGTVIQPPREGGFGIDVRDDGLQDVAVAAGDADEIALDGSLHFELGVLDGLDDFAGLLRSDPLLQVDFLFDGGTGRRNDLAVLKALQRHMSFDELGLEDRS